MTRVTRLSPVENKGYVDTGDATAQTFATASTFGAQVGALAARMRNGDALKLGICGSSTLYGQGLTPTNSTWGTGYQCWSQVLGKYSNTASTIYNDAVSGAKSDDLWRGGSGLVTVEILSAEAATRLRGLDALIYNVNFNDNGAITAAQFGENIRQGILAARRAGAIVIYIPTFAYSAYYASANASWAPAYHLAGIKAAAQAGAVIAPIEFYNSLPDGSNIDPQWYQADLTHPNQAGAARYGTAFAALWPATASSAQVRTHNPRRIYSDPEIRGNFLAWVDTLGNERRSVGYAIASDTEGYLASKPLGLSSTTFARNTMFSSDMRADSATSPSAILGNANSLDPVAHVGLSATTADANAASFLANGGIQLGGSVSTQLSAVIPAGTRRKLCPGRDDYTVRVVIANMSATNPNGTAQVLISRTPDSATGAFSIYWTSGASMSVLLSGQANTDGNLYTKLVGTNQAHLVTLTGKAGAASSKLYIDGVLVNTLTNGSNYSADGLDWVLGGRWTSTGMTALIHPAAAQIHFVDIAASYTNPQEESGFYFGTLKPLLNAAPRSLGLP